ncbi:MAG TPA: hypothetical protein VED66_09050 [Candidatus Sulfotelmatobacter sp.]|nr:hypothetical protein [Candidatus Sulfotelmatobacter sp.]
MERSPLRLRYRIPPPTAFTPAPAQITRVFVGRLELITPATQQAVESAFATHDRVTLVKYHRFLEPILSSLLQSSTDPDRTRRLESYFSLVSIELSLPSPDNFSAAQR